MPSHHLDDQELSFPFYFPMGILLLDSDSDSARQTAEALQACLPHRKIQVVADFEAAHAWLRTHALRFTAMRGDGDFRGLDDIGLIDESEVPDADALLQQANNAGVIIVRKAIDAPGCRDFLRKLMPQRVSKILLTGGADDSAALKAFNSGLIDRFVNADQEATMQNLAAYLNDLESIFFDVHNSQFTALAGERVLPFLTNVVALHELNRMCRELNARIVAPNFSPPGLRIISDDGAEHVLFVADEEIVRSRIEIAQAEYVDAKIVEQLRTQDFVYLPDLPKNRSLESMALALGDKFCALHALCSGYFYSKVNLNKHASESTPAVALQAPWRGERRGHIRDRSELS